MRKPQTSNNGNNGNEEKGNKLQSFAVKSVRMFSNGGVVADLELNGVTVYSARVVEGKQGDFISLPQRKGSDGKYYSIVYFPFTEQDTKAILREIERKLNE